MSSAFPFRDAPTTAVAVRLFAFAAALVSVVVIPATLFAAAVGRTGVATAFETAGLAAVLTLAAIVAARRVDPLRR